MSTCQYQTQFMTSLIPSVCQLYTSSHRYLIQLKVSFNFPRSNARTSKSSGSLDETLIIWVSLSSCVRARWSQNGLPASNAFHVAAYPCCQLASIREKGNFSLGFWCCLKGFRTWGLGKKMIKGDSEYVHLVPTVQSIVLWPAWAFDY